MKPVRRYSGLSVAASLLIFSPLGFYLMYKDNHYHRRFAHLLYLSAVTPIFLYIFYNYFVIPEMASLSQSLGAPLPPNAFVPLIIVSCAALLQIPVGIILDRKIKTGSVYKSYLWLAIIMLTANFFLTGYTLGLGMSGILQPIYNLTDYIK
jgi:hypothetical protein